MKIVFPKKLVKGDFVRVVAPAKSLFVVNKEIVKIAKKRLEKLGLTITFGKNVFKSNFFNSSSIKARVEDLIEAFTDKKITAIFAAIGGYNSNQLLDFIDWKIIKNNPKIFCGFSDITALNNAIFAKTGLVTYSGSNFASFGQKFYFDYSLDYFKKCLFNNQSFCVKPSEFWSDDNWKINQNKRKLINNNGHIIITDGYAEGTIIGGNLCTLNLLQGTEYFPKVDDIILFIEDDNLPKNYTLVEFDRNLQSLLQSIGQKKLKGVIIGRFQKTSKVKIKDLIRVIKAKKELNNIPVIANVAFGHTDPKITFPIGGGVKINSDKKNREIEFITY